MILTHAASVATLLTVVIAVAGGLVALALIVAGGDVLARNRTIRVRRHESVPVYYRHLARTRRHLAHGH